MIKALSWNFQFSGPIRSFFDNYLWNYQRVLISVQGTEQLLRIDGRLLALINDLRTKSHLGQNFDLICRLVSRTLGDKSGAWIGFDLDLIY
jgi:hypothetical protein